MTERELPIADVENAGLHQIFEMTQELEALIVARSTDGEVNLRRSELTAFSKEAETDMAETEAKLGEKRLAIVTVNDEIADIVNMMTDESAIDQTVADNAEAILSRGVILSQRWKSALQKKVLLKSDIAELERRMNVCEAYLSRNQIDVAKLDKGPEVVNRILGHLATALAYAKEIPEFPARPVPFRAEYQLQKDIAHGDVAEVIRVGLMAEEWSSTISVPVNVPKREVVFDPPEVRPDPSPQKPRLSRVQLPAQANRYIKVNGRK